MNRTRGTRCILECLLMAAGIFLATGGAADADFKFGEPQNLGPVINSSIWDLYPRISADGLSLHFLRRTGLGAVAEVWLATRATTLHPWENAVRLEWVDMATTYSSFDLLPGLTTADGLEFFFAADWLGGYGSGDIFQMTRETIDSAWGDPVNVGPVVNSPATEMMPAVSPGGLELYFSEYEPPDIRPGGYGHADLWVARRADRSASWEKPENLGSVINSAYQDARPHISCDGLLLFFDSQRSGGYGQGDLYVTRRATGSDPWGAPVNLGPVVNTAASEATPNISSDGSTLYWESSRPDGCGGVDIWQASIEPVVDFNTDGMVDGADLLALVLDLGTDNTLYDIGPMPWGDGVVGIEDVKVFVAEWEKANPPAQP